MKKCGVACNSVVNSIREVGGKYVINIYLFCMFGMLPLVLHNGYLDYAETKFVFFTCGSIACFGIALLCGVNSYAVGKKIWRKKTVICYIVFLISGGVSALLTDTPLRAFWGYEGRYCGIFMYLLVGCGIWIVSAGNSGTRYLYLLEFVTCVVSILGIFNHYYADPLGVYYNLLESEHGYFSSTLGGMVNVGDYLAIMFVVTAVLYCFSPEGEEGSIIHFITMVCCETAIVLNGADGAYIGLVVFFLLFPLIWRNQKEINRYWSTMFCFLLANIILEWIGLVGVREKTSGGFGIVLRHQWKVLIVLLFMNALYLLFLKRKKEDIIEAKWKKLYGLILIIVFILGVAGMVLINTGVLQLQNKTVQNWMLITDDWGNGRGYIWRQVWEGYWELPILNKIFGLGPAMLWEWSFTRTSTLSYIVEFDHAHNMFLHFLITHGLIGVLSWFGWLVGTVLVGVKKGKNEPVYYALAGGVITYIGVGMFGVNMLTITVVANVFAASMIGTSWKKEQNHFERIKAWKLFISTILILLLALTLASNGYSFVKEMMYQ